MDTISRLRFDPITPHTGAVASEIDLARPLSSATAAAIRQAVMDHGVVFFRNQDLTQDQMAAFMQNFGTLEEDPFSVPSPEPLSPREHVRELVTMPTSKATAVWHIDSTIAPEPSSFLSLRALELPETGGGDTCWGSMIAAYEGLSPPLRDLADRLFAEHTAFKVIPLMDPGSYGYVHGDMRTVHPVVRVHPQSGRRALFVNELWTERLVDMAPHESEGLLALLYAHARRPEYTMRWRWQRNDIAVWDNRSFQHYAVRDYTERRVMEKTNIAGDRPFGPTSRT